MEQSQKQKMQPSPSVKELVNRFETLLKLNDPEKVMRALENNAYKLQNMSEMTSNSRPTPKTSQIKPEWQRIIDGMILDRRRIEKIKEERRQQIREKYTQLK
ncbi:uncharacterized protein LOC111519014 [Drosophila willistoni]|uniref:uncharacterized protein LOC111519014 n=1 Tax=Drosophila willistoni TaxID=7260 RepID=UPI000C26D5F9|nr:uncharacterized protein LOC111519014 [Drosophila willistoni]